MQTPTTKHFEIDDRDFAIGDGDDRDFLARSTSDVATMDGVAYNFTPIVSPIYPQYHQYEYADLYTRGLCTGYGPMGALSTTVGVTLTPEQRKEIARLRWEASDFDQENGGGYNAAGVNVVRKWWNANNPKRKVKSIAVPVGSQAVLDALKAGYRGVWGYRGNASYGKDYRADASLDNGADWGKATYGHCLSMANVANVHSAIDNYAGRTGEGGIATNIYALPKWADMVKNRNVHQTVHFFVMESTISASQRWRFEAKKMGIWSAERENVSATRYEAAVMIERAIAVLSKSGIGSRTDYWNGTMPGQPVKRNELTLMVDRAIATIGDSFSWERMKDPATRGEVAEVVCRALYKRLGKTV